MLSAKGTYSMLGKETLWQAAESSHALLDGVGVSHAIVDGVAVCLHGYQRNTIDIDLLVRNDDSEKLRNAFTASGWTWDADQKQFSSESGAVVQFLIAGERAGRGADVRLPDPDDADSVTVLEGLPVLNLARLIESKIACGQGDARRMHKDFADVVELIALKKLNRSFERKLHQSVRPAFRELLQNARGK
ncbi:hypothetical protein Pla123a_27130 [Posidoniimonas polymericola]|uniref:Nucleotidyltransferase family protein n=1 Tax=Posidoniimonas polymericola TaxID=2528002 RepID=A0A5C5YME5_9BACT|nr:hypothetical protein [Posidoniimonas polymericola]TWT75928.1 hypothetical protein Pla123a_27130 [Posidoniimonas polymericola]